MLYPPTNSPILIFSTFDTPSSYICCFQPVLFDFYSPPTICNANSSKYLTLKKRTPFAFQNESFCLPKRVLLPSKTNPFTTQKDPFQRAKGVLLKLCLITRLQYIDSISTFTCVVSTS